MTDISPKQRDITRLCVQVAALQLQHGLESAQVVQMTMRLGLALGVDSVECALTPDAVIITTLLNGHCLTTTRRVLDKGLNMQVITEVQRIIITAEHRIYNINMVKEKLNQIKPLRYNRWLVVFMIGLSCACFAHLAGGDWTIFAITFAASALGMFVRQEFAKQHFNPLIVFAVTAFVASLISGLALKFDLGNNPQIALASSVLLLVPGFPLVNSIADILKGHINMGLARWSLATVLTFGACMGIVLALNVLNISQWGN
ncbi:threonine/serine exporter family protein [Exercitatus varius]|uniref:threonine/serine exporter family protein n=1 Tax=Exercitatus varius TaxID=67857 RepID=UPI00294AF9B9|nr:threonine/serine exporter family protein [Exercitatus varius]MDG2943058.1 threonine/serine exporter family protein [Exercitatus varius]